MCDCFTAHCHGYGCPSMIRVHCSDFCMSREDYITYCRDCMPDDDVVIYETVGKCPIDGIPSGYKMGVRYRREPPKGYGTTAVTPNTAAEWVACLIRRGKKRWFTSVSNRMFGTREKAIVFAQKLHPKWPKER